jgi:ABC-type phosphate/phosphonate transport system substrate-binding protein
MIACLPMYDRPANAAAHDVLWSGIRDALRDRGIAAPDALDRAVPYRESWQRPDLVLGHICNLPYRESFRGKVTLIAASDYGLPDCPPGYFYSVIIARKDDDRDLAALCATGRFAANARHSYSGYEGVMRDLSARGLPQPVPQITGAHDASLQAVATGIADFAGIDAQTWAMQQRDTPASASVRVVARTTPAPGITFITNTGTDPAPFAAALSEAIAGLAPQSRDLLGLRGVHVLPASAYDLPVFAADFA